MIPPKPPYAFRKVRHCDLSRLRGWLTQPHVAEWWGTPEDEIAFIEQNLTNDRIDMNLVVWEGAPFAYLQDYPVDAFDAPQFTQLPGDARDARGLDTFLGDRAFLGCGHGAAYLRQRVEVLFATGSGMVVVDPDPANHRALRTYARAGFVRGKLVAGEQNQPVQLMYQTNARTASDKPSHTGAHALKKEQIR